MSVSASVSATLRAANLINLDENISAQFDKGPPSWSDLVLIVTSITHVQASLTQWISLRLSRTRCELFDSAEMRVPLRLLSKSISRN